MEKPTTPINIDVVEMVFDIMHNNKLANNKYISGALPINRKLQDFEIDAIIIMLKNDGYIYLYDRDIYALTVKGFIFWENGGYKQQFKSLKISERYERIQTLVLTYGTGAAGAYGFFEIAKWVFHHEHWRLFF